jgi:hypothetical protein
MTDEKLTESLARLMIVNDTGPFSAMFDNDDCEFVAGYRERAQAILPLVRQIEAEAEARGFRAGIERAAEKVDDVVCNNHERGCDGGYYVCTCGLDERVGDLPAAIREEVK